MATVTKLELRRQTRHQAGAWDERKSGQRPRLLAARQSRHRSVELHKFQRAARGGGEAVFVRQGAEELDALPFARAEIEADVLGEIALREAIAGGGFGLHDFVEAAEAGFFQG